MKVLGGVVREVVEARKSFSMGGFRMNWRENNASGQAQVTYSSVCIPQVELYSSPFKIRLTLALLSMCWGGGH
jgi:hypothetical protein